MPNLFKNIKVLLINEPFRNTAAASAGRQDARQGVDAPGVPSIFLDFVKKNAIFIDNILLKVDFNMTR